MVLVDLFVFFDTTSFSGTKGNRSFIVSLFFSSRERHLFFGLGEKLGSLVSFLLLAISHHRILINILYRPWLLYGVLL